MWYVVVQAELLALLGAFLLGSGTVLTRRELVKSNFLSATIITTSIGTIVFCILFILLVPLNDMNPVGIVIFALAGLFNPGFARLTYFKGIKLLGASMNSSIFAVYPLFSSLFAIFLLGERPSLGIWVGMICIICGVVLIERNVHGTPVYETSYNKTVLAYPISTALLVGFGDFVRKMGLNAYNEPIAGVAIAYLSSLLLYTLMSTLSTTVRRSMSPSKQGLQQFWKAGLIFCAGHLCAYYALRYGDVSLVAPLRNIEPFFIFILAYVLIRKLEKITYKLVLGTLILVTGVSLITLF